MSIEGETCHWCQLAPARAGALRRPACHECADAIASFFRGEKWRLQAIADEHRAKR